MQDRSLPSKIDHQPVDISWFSRTLVICILDPLYRWSRNVAKISEAGKVNSAPVETWDGMSDRKHVL